MVRRNCWEVKKCGREPGGINVSICGACPVPQECRLHAQNGGVNAGRACWVVAGTMCGGEIQGTFAVKYLDCTKCDFYVAVRQEEGEEFVTSIELMRIIGHELM